MRRDPVSTPPNLPAPAACIVGRVVRVPAGKARYRRSRLTVHVTRVLEDISLWYGGEWVWIEGVELDDQGGQLRRVQALVHVDTLAPPRPGEGGA